jgi:IS5 family transposase
MICCARRGLRQKARRNTRSEGKLLSLFEPSTEVIRKGKAGKPNEFGKMVKLQEAENQIITDTRSTRDGLMIRTCWSRP